MLDRELTPEEYYTVIRATQTAKMVGVCNAHLLRLEKAGLFPKRFKINPAGGPYGAAGHLLGHVVDAIKARMARKARAAEDTVA